MFSLTYFPIMDSPFVDLESPLTSYEIAKLVLLTPLAILRAVMCAFPILFLTICAEIAILNCDMEKPLSGWRHILFRYSSIITMRSLLFIFGFYNIQLSGQKNIAEAYKKKAIIVFTHISWVDSFIFAWLMDSCGVAKDSNKNLPLFSAYIRASQPIFIQYGQDGLPRSGTSNVIAARAADHRFPSLIIIAPEGTTSNGKCILKFKTGAFVSKNPVLPVILSYPNKHINPTWSIDGPLFVAWRLATQFVNYARIDCLEIQYAAPDESPAEYAERVRRFMASKSGRPMKELSQPDYVSVKNTYFLSWDRKHLYSKAKKS